MSATRPAPGTRPANRRELILDAATDLFADHGYENVNVADVAAAVAVGPSALYRHFPGKESLLSAVVARTAELVRATTAAAATAGGLEAALPVVAATLLDHRSLGVLWQRESRHLPAVGRRPLAVAFGDLGEQLARGACTSRPGLPPRDAAAVSTAVLGVLLSPAFHHVDLPRPRFEEVLAATAAGVLAAGVADRADPGEEPDPARPVGLARSVRREATLRAALDLFAERTYASVGMEDIAAGAGIATSSVYHQFPSKADLLATALHRGNGYLQLTLDRILTRAEDEAGALRDLVEVYSDFALAHPALVDLLITEHRNLPAEEAGTLLGAQRDYVREWVHLHQVLRPDLTDAESTVVVQGALMAVNDLARAAEVRERPRALALVRRLALGALLG